MHYHLTNPAAVVMATGYWSNSGGQFTLAELSFMYYKKGFLKFLVWLT